MKLKTISSHLISLLVATLLTTCLPCISSAQSSTQTTDKTESVSGRVTIHAKGFGGATVQVWPWPSTVPPPGGTFTAQTDQDGNYRVAILKPGNYYISARAEGFVLIENGQPAQPKYFSLAAGHALTDVNFEMVRGGVISGRVTNSEGQPIAEEPITLSKVQVSSNPPLSSSPFLAVRTDDRGMYRIFGIAPGRYKLVSGWPCVAMATTNNRLGYQRVFYPGVADESKARVIEITEGTEASNIDLNPEGPVKTFSISGRIVDNETGQPIPDLKFGLDILTDPKAPCGNSQAGSTNSKGEFKIENAPIGRYSIRIPPALVATSAPPSAYFSERTPFDLTTQDVTNIEVRAMRTSNVSGLVVLEGTTDRAALEKLSKLSFFVMTMKIGAPMSRQVSRIGADGTFSVSGLNPGSINWSVPPPFQVKRIERGNVEQTQNIELKAGEQVADVRLVLVYGSATVSGAVRLENGTLPPDTKVVARLWSIPQSRMPVSATFVDSKGNFLMENVPAGTYRLVVSPDSSIPQQKPPMSQCEVVVKDGAVTDVTLTLDLKPAISSKP